MEIQWNPVDPEIWDDFHAQHLGSLQQSWAYGNTLKALGIRVHRAWVWGDDRPLALAQFVDAKSWVTCRWPRAVADPSGLKPSTDHSDVS